MIVVFSSICFGAICGATLLLRYRIRRTEYCKNKVELNGKTVLITGGNTGIGKAVAIEMAKRKARVIIASRDEKRTNSTVMEIIKASANQAEVFGFRLDLSSFKSIKKFTEALRINETKIDILIENAGYIGPLDKSADGMEKTFSVNHLGHFLLFQELLPLLKSGLPSRVIVVSSDALYHGDGRLDVDDPQWLTSPRPEMYHPFISYGRSKLANLLFAKEINNKFTADEIMAFAVHPGPTNTTFFHNWSSHRWKITILRIVAMLLFRTAEQASQTIIHCATEIDLLPNKKNLELFVDCKRTFPELRHTDENLSARLWEFSELLVNEEG